MAAKTPAQWKTLFENVPFHRENYYTGPLGPDYTPGGTCLRLWAPTAEAVTVTLYHKGDGGAVLGTEPLVRGAQGVWSVWLPGEQHGRYYTFAVTVDGVTVELSDEKQQRLAEHNVAEQDVTLGVRPDHLMLCADGIKGTVDVSEMMGSSVHLHVAAEGKDVIVIVPTNGAAAHFPMGSEVNMIFGGNVAHVFDKETGKNLEW